MDGVKLLAILTLLTNFVFVFAGLLFLAARLTIKFKPFWYRVEAYFTTNSLLFAFIISLTATFGSLYFSEIRHLEPCKLCWFQRILMYPLTLIIGTAIYKKLKGVWNYILPISFLGIGIAAYHYYYQVTGSPLIPCSTVGFSVSCSERFFTYWGYITIPWMSLSAFTSIFFLMLLNKKSK